jgi:glycerol transport system ATP-binding protein
MAKIELKHISHSYQMERCDVLPEDCDISTEFVIRDLNLVWDEGTANALLGPSGCGKTTILNIISGLLRPTHGQILYDGKDVTELPPEKRKIAQVFQFPVIYDTISVYKNLAFPLQNAGVPKKKIERRVAEIAGILDLTGLLKKSAGSVSQADKQKISLGRGIIREDTVAILFDEPLTVIDPKEKYVLRRKIREVQRQLKITTIYVTHDQHEALTFADHITVLKDGKIVQTGTPAELHAEPQSPFIGYFIGSPGMNLLNCTQKEDRLDFGEFSIPLTAAMRAAVSSVGGDFLFGIRPEFAEVSRQLKDGWISWTVNFVENIGSHKILTLTSNGLRIKCRVPALTQVLTGDRVWVNFPPERIKIYKDDKRIY